MAQAPHRTALLTVFGALSVLAVPTFASGSTAAGPGVPLLVAAPSAAACALVPSSTSEGATRLGAAQVCDLVPVAPVPDPAPTSPVVLPPVAPVPAPAPTSPVVLPPVAPTPSATPAAPSTPATAAPRPARDLFLQPFSSTSIWNLPIATTATFASPGSDPATASLLGGDPTTWLNQDTYSHPVVRAAATDPLLTVTDRNDSSRSATYAVPSSAVPAQGTDAHLHVVSPDGRHVDEAWAVERTSSGLSVGRHERVDLAGDGLGPSNGTRAYGGSALGGLIRAWEIDPSHPDYTGRISHPIAMALRSDQLLHAGGQPGYDAAGYGTARGYTWPATEQDWDSAWSYSGQVPMGTYFAIPGSVDLDGLGLSPQGRVLAQAYQDFGGYVTDRSGATILGFVEPSAPTAFGAALLGPSWSASDLRIIRAQLRRVTSNGEQTPNGGALSAPRRAPLAR